MLMKKITIGLLKLVHVINTENNEFNGFLATGYKDFVENEDTGFIFSKVKDIIIDDKATEQFLRLEYSTNGFTLIKNQKKENHVFTLDPNSREDTAIPVRLADKYTLKNASSSIVIEVHSSGTIHIRPVKLTSSLLCFHNAKQQKLNCKLQ